MTVLIARYLYLAILDDFSRVSIPMVCIGIGINMGIIISVTTACNHLIYAQSPDCLEMRHLAVLLFRRLASQASLRHALNSNFPGRFEMTSLPGMDLVLNPRLL